MITVKIKKTQNDDMYGFVVTGHAGFGKKGKDIVCAAVSSVAYNAINALQELVGISDFKQNDGYIKCDIPDDLNESDRYKINIILKTIEIGFKQIASSYPRHVSVLYEEV